mmetsp:Transcript_3752/g.10316  ORF Transcript_3752/g.10316 Transcript_3752/m.10316 type:complete len:214 (-) Transcript_3752:858-1499(-)
MASGKATSPMVRARRCLLAGTPTPSHARGVATPFRPLTAFVRSAATISWPTEHAALHDRHGPWGPLFCGFTTRGDPSSADPSSTHAEEEHIAQGVHDLLVYHHEGQAVHSSCERSALVISPTKLQNPFERDRGQHSPGEVPQEQQCDVGAERVPLPQKRGQQGLQRTEEHSQSNAGGGGSCIELPHDEGENPSRQQHRNLGGRKERPALVGGL